ncbi:uncharacterized protein LOC131856799 [Cryptomeria japonica]|uniref:uncharacterized protein LOC131856799 n=1 Tax=Cryptomeria japonica TaxID=3369 RepID=UPI0027DA1935|nr:uncharacterized protein LOC131856799 [Cryptomeria japonica]
METINYKLAFSMDSSKPFSSWDESIKKNWQGIKISPSFEQKSKSRKEANWTHPKPGWSKLNFDGASKGNSSPSGIGYVIRDHLGAIIGKMAKPLPPDTNNIAEFKPLQLGLMDCIKHGLRNIIVEGDSEIAINAIKRQKTPNWRLQAILDSILENLAKLEQYEAKHIFREVNIVADVLSKATIEGAYIHWWDQGVR